METSGFFNAEVLADGSYDRIYMAEQFAKYFSRFIGNGVFITPASQLKVVPKAGEMGVLISIGDAYINGYWYQNDAVIAKKLSNASGVNSRIDRIVLRWDSSTRTIYSAVLQGTSAALPEAPAVTRSADVYELALADILIGKAITEIKEENITDLRNNSNLCGYVKGVVDQIDTTDLFSQFTASFNSWFADLKAKGDARYDDFDKALQQYSAAFDVWFTNIKKKGDDRYNEFDQLLDQYSNEFNTWFDTVKGQLDADAATKLSKAVADLQSKTKEFETSIGENKQSITDANDAISSTDKKVQDLSTRVKTNEDSLKAKASKSKVSSYTLRKSGWKGSAAPFTFVLNNISGVTDSNNIELVVPSNISLAQVESYQSATIVTGIQAKNSITLKAYGKKPTIDLPITVIVRGD